MPKQSLPADRPPWIAWIDTGDLVSLRRWLAQGGDVEVRDPETNNTPLVYVAWHGPVEAAHLLLVYGAIARSSGAFLIAVSTNHFDIARLLLPLTDDIDDLKQAADVLVDSP